MSQEEKQLLLVDLSARLPYGVKVRYKSVEGEGDIKLGYGNIGYVPELGRGWWIECKPYLRPMSSMTEEEYNELKAIAKYYGFAPFEYIYDWCPNYEAIDWLNAHYFDYHGLIKKGLAIAVDENNNPYKE